MQHTNTPTNTKAPSLSAQHEGPTLDLSAGQYLALESINGHILEGIEMPAPQGMTVTLWGVRLNGSREGLACVLADGGVWNLYHVSTGVILFSAKVRGLSMFMSALGRCLSMQANWQAASITELNTQAHDSLKALRHWLS